MGRVASVFNEEIRTRGGGDDWNSSSNRLFTESASFGESAGFDEFAAKAPEDDPVAELGAETVRSRKLTVDP